MDGPTDYINQMDINTKGFPPNTQMIENFPENGERKIRVCRCWQSKRFPYCDDTHKQLMESGDNVGPFVVKLKSETRGGGDKIRNVSAIYRRIPKRTFAGVMLCAGIGGYLVADILKNASRGDEKWSLSRSISWFNGRNKIHV
eukprot:Platyproteum_vivax@DN1064_c0_g2_i1.p1